MSGRRRAAMREPGSSSPAASPVARGRRRGAGGRRDPSSSDGHLQSSSSAAVEDNDLLDSAPPADDDLDEDDGEELFGDNMLADYKEKKHLDKYERKDIDDEDYDHIAAEDRLAVERALAKRDREQMIRDGRIPAALKRDSDDSEHDHGAVRRRRRLNPRAEERQHQQRLLAERALHERDDEIDGDGRGAAGGLTMDLQGDDDDDAEYDEGMLDDRKGHPLREWISLDGPRREIKKRFKGFLQRTVDENGNNIHSERISRMCQENKESLVVSYVDLMEAETMLAVYIADAPAETIAILDEAATELVMQNWSKYNRIHEEIHVRISDLPVVEALRDIRQGHLNQLVKVSGVVTRRNGVYPQLKVVYYDCGKCGYTCGPYYQNQESELKVGACPDCQSKGPFAINMEETIYRNYQKIVLQESPGSVPPGRLPRQKEVVLLCDLVDSVKPGDEIEVTGIYRNNFDASLNTANGFPVFSTVIEANYVNMKSETYASLNITEEDRLEILALRNDPNLGRKIINSIAPSIYGHDDVKTAIALAMFGGDAKNKGDGHRVRGDINILLLGDPGTAKSQFLKYVEKTAQRAVFTTGQGASAVGLTASVHRDPILREWTLEGGALVLADRGVCMIDEFDKMSDQDRTSIHEAMEQQTISISKAGIVTTLQARCAVIAAANPTRGRYDASKTFADNVDLSEPILSRFDVLCVVRDTIDPVADERLAHFVIGSHVKNHPGNREQLLQDAAQKAGFDADEQIPQALLRKYLMYARSEVHPKMDSDAPLEKIMNVYCDLREFAIKTSSTAVTARTLEGLQRLAHAHARLHLRNSVNDMDVEAAIRVVVQSFIATQKHSNVAPIRNRFARYLTLNEDYNPLVLHRLRELVNGAVLYERSINGNKMPASIAIDVAELEAQAKQVRVEDLTSFFASPEFRREFQLNTDIQKIVKVFA